MKSWEIIVWLRSIFKVPNSPRFSLEFLGSAKEKKEHRPEIKSFGKSKLNIFNRLCCKMPNFLPKLPVFFVVCPYVSAFPMRSVGTIYFPAV